MNKKFSTLLASTLLASTVGAYAQIAPTPEGGFAKFLNAPTVEVNNVEKGLVQLAVKTSGEGTEAEAETEIQAPETADLVLAMIPGTDGTYTLKAVSPADDSDVELRYTLWTVVADGDGVSGYNYQLQNLGTGELLAFNSIEATAFSDAEVPSVAVSAATKLGAEVASWTWMPTPSLKEGKFFEEGKGLTSVFKSDSVLTLVGTGTLAANVEVAAVKYSNKNIPSTISNTLEIYPVAPAPFLLGVNDLNSMLWKQGADGKMQLTFNPDVKAAENKNVFTQALKAESAVGYPFQNYKWNAYKETDPNVQQDVLKLSALYDYDFYQAANTFLDAYAAAVTKDQDAVDAAGVLTAVYAALAEGKKGDYDAILAEVKKYDAGTNAVKGKIKTAFINYLKAAKPAFVNTDEFVTAFGCTASNTIANGYWCMFGQDAFTKANVLKKVADSKTVMALDAKKTAAEDERKTTNKSKIDAQGWVSLKTNDGKYVMVDTAYMTTNAGQKYLKLIDNAEFKDLKANSAGEALSTGNWTRQDINGRFNFQFVYYPNQDSLVIRSAGFATLSDQDADKDAVSYFKDLSLTENFMPGATSATVASTERNLVKIAVLGNKDHRELTIGNSEFDRLMNPVNTINTRISLLDIANTYVKTTLPAGVYHFNLFTELASRAAENGKFAIADFDGSEMEWNTPETNFAWGEVQKYANMPRTQWVVVKNNATATSTVDIYNREYPQICVKRVQLYKAGENVFAANWSNASTTPAWTIAKADTLAYTKLAADNNKIGYKQMPFDDKLMTNYFNLRYFNGLDEGNLVEIAEDKALFVNPEAEAGTRFQFVNTANDAKYGYNNTLVRDSYKVMDKATGKYLKADGKSGYVLVEAASATTFLFKENNGYATEEGEWVPYYALVSGENNANVSGVKHPSLVVSVESTTNENSIATFAFEDTEKYDYRRLGKTVNDGLINTSAETEGLNTVKFFRTNVENTFLYENTMNRNANNGAPCLNFLGEVNLNDKPANAALPIVVDTAYVRNNTTKPLYMLAVRYNWIEEGEEVIPCLEHGYDCEHAQKVNTPAHSKAAYLVALNDSVKAHPEAKYQGNVRLAFVDAKHIADTLVIASSEFTHAVKDPAKKDSLFFADKKMNRATFAFKLVNPLAEEGDVEYGDFIIEAEGNQYVRVHNSVPVLVNTIDDAATFNVEATDEEATSNESISATGVKVVATEGAVIVKGAEGKKVVITNVLGQTIANTVVTSSEATIAAPQGVVVVAVDGEAVKAIVK